MRNIMIGLMLLAPDICYASRGGYTLGKPNPIGGFFLGVMYCAYMIYIYCSSFSRLKEMWNDGEYRDFFVAVAGLFFWSIPLFCIFLV